MITDEVFKRRPGHNNTPESILLIITNFIVVSAAAALFINHHHINWFFWIIMAALAVYNAFSIRKNIEVYKKIDIIAYAISVLVLAGLVAVLYLGL